LTGRHLLGRRYPTFHFAAAVICAAPQTFRPRLGVHPVEGIGIMPQRLMRRLPRLRLLRLSVAAALAFAVVIVPATVSAAPKVNCDTQVNDTPDELLPCITKDDLWAHMQAFQAIADANPGPDGHASRNSGEPGYKASVDYVANLMTEAGYNVTIQTYKFFYYAFAGTPTLQEASPVAHDYGLLDEWGPGQSLGSATAAGLQAAGGIIIPPTDTPTSTSGCTMADFNGFVAGRIALIQRGGCNFGVKVLNAKAAGASGVVIFNEGNKNPDRTGLVIGSLVDAAGNRIVPDIPVAFTTFAVGNTLFSQYQDAVKNGTAVPILSLSIPAVFDPNRDDYNLIAESKGGDKNHVLVVDAHLDAIYGAGMLDNASGSAAILDIAQEMKNVNPLNKLRFIWFGGEELGLLGSAYYVNNLSATERSHIGYDLDADVLATPNYSIGVLDPAGPDLFGGTSTATFPNRVYKASMVARDQAVAYFDSIGKNHKFFSPVGTDAFSFNEIGIPASGLLTGQDCCKPQDEVDLFGGFLGNYEGNVPSFDGGCVDLPFRWCDNLSNNDPDVLTFMSKAFATMVVQMAFDNNVMSSSNNAVYKNKVPNASASRWFATK
jgi:Peptidase family M28/PA domain